MRRLLTCLSVIFVCSVASAQGLSPARVVKGNRLTSQNDPSLRIDLPVDVKYVGGSRWLLQGVADCELHVFVEADTSKRIKRLYWIQFEGFTPQNSDLRYNYADPRTEVISGMEFFVRAGFGVTSEVPPTGSDTEAVQSILRTAGYTIPGEVMNVRLVHLLDDQRRKELMVIYAEDLQLAGLSVPQLSRGDANPEQWNEVADALIRRAIGTITLVRE